MIDTAGGSTSAPAGEAAIPASPAPHIVHLACRCPGTPHAFDVVTLHERATIPLGIAFAAAVKYASDQVAMEAELAMVYLRYGISAWTFRDSDGPVAVRAPIDPEVLERWLPFSDGGLVIVEAADAIYGESVMRPLLARRSKSSPDGLTGPLTSVTNGSGPTHPRPSGRSSRTATAGRRSGQ